MTLATGVPASLPSPTQGVWNVGPFPLRAYAVCILAGIVVAVWLGDRRWRARGGRPGTVLDIAAWAVPFGIVGGRLYHVATTWQPYFGPGGHPVQALYIWEGGLGIWGAITLGGVGAYIGARRANILMPPLADALAPGIVLAQAIGRWGNWFNNELYGGPTTLPWGLQIHQWDAPAGHAVTGPDGKPVVLGTFHPTFLYESLWDVATAVVLILLDRRFRIGHGRLFALYVLIYTIGRGWIEALRVDPANHVLGLRLNIWTSLLVGLGALIYLIVSARRRPGREESVEREPRGGAATTDDIAAEGAGEGAGKGAGNAAGNGLDVGREDRAGDRAGAADDEGVGRPVSPATARWLAWVRTRPGRRDDSDDATDDATDDASDDATAGASAGASDDATEGPRGGATLDPPHGGPNGGWRDEPPDGPAGGESAGSETAAGRAGDAARGVPGAP